MKPKSLMKPFVLVVPASLLVSCLSYGPRMRSMHDGKERCEVQSVNNPPRLTEVSCDAPIQPPLEGESWCRVATVAGHMTHVDCDSD